VSEMEFFFANACGGGGGEGQGPHAQRPHR